VDASLDVLNRLAGELRGSRKGHLHIGCIPSVAAHLLPQVLGTYMAGQRDMAFSIHTGNTPQVMEWVETQQVDLGICLHLRDLPNADYKPLMQLRMECLLPVAHPLSARPVLTLPELQPYPVINVELSAAPLHVQQAIELDERFGLARIRVDMSFVACRMVEAGLGIAVADNLSVGRSVSATLTRRALDHPFRAELGTYIPTYRPRHRAVDDLLQGLAVETAQSLPATP
jgi:DNA-binding transcriptional LysR family regulator